MLPKVSLMGRPASAHARLPAIAPSPPSHRSEEEEEDDEDAYREQRVLFIPVALQKPNSKNRNQAWTELLSSPTRLLPLDPKPLAFINTNGYSSTSPGYSSSGSSICSPPPDDVGRKLSTLEREMIDKFHDLDLLKKEMKEIHSRKGRKAMSRSRVSPFDLMPLRSLASQDHSGIYSLEEELASLKKDKRIMADLLKQTQRHLTKRDLIIQQLKNTNQQLQQEVIRNSSQQVIPNGGGLSGERDEHVKSRLADLGASHRSTEALPTEFQKPRNYANGQAKLSSEGQKSDVLRSCLSEVMESVLAWEFSFSEQVKSSRTQLECSFRELLEKESDDSEFRRAWAQFGLDVMESDRRAQRLQEESSESYESKLESLGLELAKKSSALTGLMSEMEKVSGQLEHQMENVMELHDENRSLREMISSMEDRLEEYRAHQLDNESSLQLEKERHKKLDECFAEACTSCLGLSVPYISGETLEYIFQQFDQRKKEAVSEARNHWERQISDVTHYVHQAEAKLTREGRTVSTMEEVVRESGHALGDDPQCQKNAPTDQEMDLKGLETLKEALLQAYNNQMNFIKHSLADEENNNCGKCRENSKMELKFPTEEEVSCVKASFSFSESYRRINGHDNKNAQDDISRDETEAIFEKQFVANDPFEWDSLFRKLSSISEENESAGRDEDREEEDEDESESSEAIFHKDLLRELQSIIMPDSEDGALSSLTQDQQQGYEEEDEEEEEEDGLGESRDAAGDSGYNSGRSRVDQSEDPVELEDSEAANKYSVENRFKGNYVSPRNSFIYPMIEEETQQELTEEGEDDDDEEEEEEGEEGMIEICDYYGEKGKEPQDGLSVILESDSEDEDGGTNLDEAALTSSHESIHGEPEIQQDPRSAEEPVSMAAKCVLGLPPVSGHLQRVKEPVLDIPKQFEEQATNQDTVEGCNLASLDGDEDESLNEVFEKPVLKEKEPLLEVVKSVLESEGPASELKEPGSYGTNKEASGFNCADPKMIYNCEDDRMSEYKGQFKDGFQLPVTDKPGGFIQKNNGTLLGSARAAEGLEHSTVAINGSTKCANDAKDDLNKSNPAGSDRAIITKLDSYSSDHLEPKARETACEDQIVPKFETRVESANRIDRRFGNRALVKSRVEILGLEGLKESSVDEDDVSDDVVEQEINEILQMVEDLDEEDEDEEKVDGQCDQEVRDDPASECAGKTEVTKEAVKELSSWREPEDDNSNEDSSNCALPVNKQRKESSEESSNTSSGHLGDVEEEEHPVPGRVDSSSDEAQPAQLSDPSYDSVASKNTDVTDNSEISECLALEDDHRKMPLLEVTSKSQLTQTEMAGALLIEKLEELETAVGEMSEVKEQHMKVACGVAEQLEELRAEEHQWANKENRYRDEIAAWKQNVELQNAVLQQLREDLENAHNSLQERENNFQELRMQMNELQVEMSTPVLVCNLSSRESQTDFGDANDDLMAYIEQLRAEIASYIEEMKRQELVIYDVRSETEATISHLLNLKAEAAEKVNSEAHEWRTLLEKKDGEIRRLRTELLHLSEMVEVKGVVISQQIQNIKSLLGELGRCEVELKTKTKILQQMQEKAKQQNSKLFSQRASQTEQDYWQSMGESCLKEGHGEQIVQQGQLINQLQDQLQRLNSKLNSEVSVENQASCSSGCGGQQNKRANGHLTNGHLAESDVFNVDEVWTTEGDDRPEEDHWKRKPSNNTNSKPRSEGTRLIRDRSLPLPFKNGKILFLQQDLENRRKEILKTEMKLRRIQAKMADEVKKGRAPLKAT